MVVVFVIIIVIVIIAVVQAVVNEKTSQLDQLQTQIAESVKTIKALKDGIVQKDAVINNMTQRMGSEV